MKRQTMLITACGLAAVSLGGNVWMLMHRNEKREPGPLPPPREAPKLPSVDIDFSGTGLSDDAWNLTDETKKPMSLDEPIDLSDFGFGVDPNDPNNVRDKALYVAPPEKPAVPPQQ